jgi:hypothetical protein
MYIQYGCVGHVPFQIFVVHGLGVGLGNFDANEDTDRKGLLIFFESEQVRAPFLECII